MLCWDNFTLHPRLCANFWFKNQRDHWDSSSGDPEYLYEMIKVVDRLMLFSVAWACCPPPCQQLPRQLYCSGRRDRHPLLFITQSSCHDNQPPHLCLVTRANRGTAESVFCFSASHSCPSVPSSLLSPSFFFPIWPVTPEVHDSGYYRGVELSCQFPLLWLRQWQPC